MPSTTVVPVPNATTVIPKAAPSALLSDQAQDIPIFLRKTYHMVDTCDPSIACWSTDGETFVVKDPVKFEQQIIPQFFKHSKFSSFVRQLNFYAFRKIKYADTIRIDPKLEAETANYWRFRHEKFQRGKPELLQEIKRMNGQKGANSSKKITTPTTTTTNTHVDKENTILKSEVSQLKSKLDQMSKNMDELTRMVQKVSLQQQQATPTSTSLPTQKPVLINSNNKRTKLDETMPPLPDIAPSSVMMMDVDAMTGGPPSIPSPMHPTLTTNETPSDLSDDSFVDQLFTAFKTENFDFVEESSVATPTQTPSTLHGRNNKKPSPELMQKLSDALEVLPPSIQEMIVNRLVQAITAPQEIQNAVSGKEDAVVPPDSPKSPNLPLAAATLAALLSQYGEDAIKAAAASVAKDPSTHKALLIPVHA